MAQHIDIYQSNSLTIGTVNDKFRASPQFATTSPRQTPGQLPCSICISRSKGICAPLDDGCLAQLRALGGVRRWSKGETLFRAGEPIGWFYKVTKGVVAVYRGLENGRRQILSIHSAGDSCGFLEENRGYALTGDAITDVEACGFDRRGFNTFADQHLDLAKAVRAELAQRLKQITEMMTLIGQCKAVERVAYFLLKVAASYDSQSGAELPLSLP